MTVPEGYGIIAGRSREIAQAAIAAAVAAGFDSSIVRTQREGYLVPVKVLDEYQRALDGGSESVPLTQAQKTAKYRAEKKAAAEAAAAAEETQSAGEAEPEVVGEPGVVVDAEGVEHVGELPVSATDEGGDQTVEAESEKED